MTGAKPISLSGFNRRVRIGSHRKNLIFAPCAAAMGFLLAHSAAFVLYCKKQQGCLVQFCCCNLSPRGDGKHTLTILVILFSCCNLSPRGDGNRVDGRKYVGSQGRCNLSPRGDGNTRGRSSPSSTIPLQLIPARGRKHRLLCVQFPLPAMLQLIPARGRKQLPVVIHPAFQVATYPREGTETGA